MHGRELVAVMMLKRPDDAEGIGFAKQIAALRRRVAKRRIQPVAVERVEWWLDEQEPGAPLDWSVSAFPEGYHLMTLSVMDSFLETQPPDKPKISWTVHRVRRGYATLVMGGQAPTLQAGQARAEAIWRIDAGVRSDA